MNAEYSATMGLEHKYERAPIAEAAIELRFETPIDDATIKKAVVKLEPDYPFADPQQIGNIKIDAAAKKADFVSASAGFRLSNLDRTDVILLQPGTFICARIAPYSGWEELFARLQKGWEALTRASGSGIRLSRVGVRYINRIDVPEDGRPSFNMQEYLLFAPLIPADIIGGPISQYTLRLQYPLGSDGLDLILTSALVPSPLIKHASILLDIDISREAELPRRMEEIWELLAVMRGHKNRIFEACITDRARELFDQ